MSNFIIRIYASLLRLYPKHFYETFAAEMVDVFTAALAESRSKGLGNFFRLILWESLHFPPSVLHEHIHAHHSPTNPLAWWSFITVMISLVACFLLGVTSFFTFEIGIATAGGRVSDWMTLIGGRPVPLLFVSALLWMLTLIPLSISTSVMSLSLIRNWQVIELSQRLFALLILITAAMTLIFIMSAPLHF